MANDPFIRNFNPPIGTAEQIAPGLRRIVAPNASAMTFTGTNTYVLGTTALAIIDPGPDDPDHFAAILNAVGPSQQISHILVTHSHVDHSPLARRLGQHTGALIMAYGDSYSHRSPRMQALAKDNALGGGEGVDRDFKPDICLKDNALIDGAGWQLQALYTPGHFSNHMCFAWPQAQAVFTGDHVMSWATTMVSPPDGDLTAFMASLEVMGARKQDKIYFPGHGAPVQNPAEMVSYLREHRFQRETQILSSLADGENTVMAITTAIYQDIPKTLIPAASRNVFAHLIDLIDKNKVSVSGNISADSIYTGL